MMNSSISAVPVAPTVMRNVQRVRETGQTINYAPSSAAASRLMYMRKDGDVCFCINLNKPYYANFRKLNFYYVKMRFSKGYFFSSFSGTFFINEIII